jgi:hypothetical protein
MIDGNLAITEGSELSAPANNSASAASNFVKASIFRQLAFRDATPAGFAQKSRSCHQ